MKGIHDIDKQLPKFISEIPTFSLALRYSNGWPQEVVNARAARSGHMSWKMVRIVPKSVITAVSGPLLRMFLMDTLNRLKDTHLLQ